MPSTIAWRGSQNRITSISGLQIIILFIILQIATLTRGETSYLPRLRKRAPAKPFTVPATYHKETADGVGTYSIKVTLGSKDFDVQLDTGSTALWVLSTLLPTDKYDDAKKYPAGVPPPCSVDTKVEYEHDLVVKGTLLEATAAIGQISWDEWEFVAASSIEPDCTFCLDTSMAGIIGLDPEEKSWVTQAYWAGKMDPIFTLSLRQEGGSKVIFSQAAKDISHDTTWFPLDATGYSANTWTFSSGKSGPSYLVDCGSSVSLIPTDIARSYFGQQAASAAKEEVNGANVYWTVPCSTKLPDLSFKLGDFQVDIPGSSLSGKMERDGECLVPLSGYDPSHESRDYPAYMLGITFIEQFDVHFDIEGKRIGIEKVQSS